MLKLKKLQILGFKSFCDRTELNFHGDGLAAVVGPNGCGKSNISDAISWVLGEQSAKTLRGSRMEDVIFAGTRDRKPTGMAEVSLTLIDPEVYEGAAGITEPEIDVRDGFDSEDWDEAALRSRAAEATEQAIVEAQPGVVLNDDEQAQEPEPAAAEAELQPQAAENEVVLKIRRRKFNHKFRAGEIVVTRRLFRSGDSEYLLNGKLCRLRDIQDLFMGTGLGPESYAIIEQGRIGQILSSKPHDRRAIIEEAAGITKYKTKKRLAELRLEQARQNLSRVNDIFEEVTRQMNSLKRQAAKAERYAKLRDEMRDKLRIVLASKFGQLTAEQKHIDEQLAAIAEELRAKGESVQAMETEHAERIQHGYQLETELQRNREHLNLVALESERATARRGSNQERCAELVARAAAAEGELARAQEQFGALNQELASNRAVLESAAADVAAAQQESTLRQQQALEAATALADVEQRQELRRGEMLSILSAANAVRNHVAQAEEGIAALDRDRDRLDQELSSAVADIDHMGGRRGQLGLEFENVTQTVNAVTARIGDVRAQLTAKRDQEILAKGHLDILRAEHATALGKRNSLQSVLAEHGYSTESVKRLFQSGALDGGRAPVGTLADFLEVDDKYEGVVEDFLRDELNYIIVKSWDAADEGLRLLQSDVDGRATFLVHPSDAQAKFSFAVDDAHYEAKRRQAVTPVKDAIRVLNGFGRSLEVILPKLRDGYITPDSGTARGLALENPDAFFLSPNGEMFHNVTVTGGKQRSEGPLSLKRELRECERAIVELEAAMSSEQLRIETLSRELRELESLLQRLEGDLREAEKQAMSSGHALKQMESEIARTEQRVNSYRVELDRVRTAREQKESLLAAKRDQLVQHDARQAALQQELDSAQATLAELRSARDLAAQASSEAAARVAGLEERRRAAQAGLQRIETLTVEVSSRVESLQQQIAAAVSEREQRERENLDIAARLEQLTTEREQTEARAQELHTETEAVRARIAEIDGLLREARAALDAARDRRGDLSATLARLQSDSEHLSQDCLNELSVSMDDLRSDLTLVTIDGEALAAEDAAVREMKARLENMGPVNMMALEEYNEVAERHGFLETQRKDLLDSIENTQQTIREIDEVSKQKFEEAFHHINENFQRTFLKLFGGGQGFMRLTDEENSSESGIDIVASPPGKKLQNVLLLSGGEKAMTALALLVGIFQYQPSPFCVLDEVDAPLDEANVGRFVELVREMSAHTQFVVITHSKRTMAASPVMYGVTMQEPGVSKILSVKFDSEAARATA